MGRRVIAPELFEDEWFGCLEDREQLVWVGLFGALADDQGRLLDNPALIRARLWPYRDVPVPDIAAAADRFIRDGRLLRYRAAGKPLLQIVNWWRHQKPQWAQRSSWSAPEGWTDRIRYTSNKVTVAEGWDTPGGFLDVQVDTPGGPLQVDTPGGPSSYAHEPVPVPEPVNESPDGLSAQAADDRPEEQCPLRRLDLDHELTAAAARAFGPKAGGAVYNVKGEKHRLTAALAKHVCAEVHIAGGALSCDKRLPVCRRAVFAVLEQAGAADRPVAWLQAIASNGAEILPEEQIAELRALDRTAGAELVTHLPTELAQAVATIVEATTADSPDEDEESEYTAYE